MYIALDLHVLIAEMMVRVPTDMYYRWRFNDLSCFEAIDLNVEIFYASVRIVGQACLLTAGDPFFFQPSLTDGTDLPNTQMKVDLVHEVYKVGFYY